MNSKSRETLATFGIVIAMLLGPLLPVASPVVAAPATVFAVRELPPTGVGLYRTTVRIESEARFRRMMDLGVVLLERGEESAVVLADDEQLAALARLRFGPSASDDLASLVATAGNPWLAVAAEPLLRAQDSLRAVFAAAGVSPDGVDVAAADARGSLRAAARALTPEQRRALAETFSIDDDGDGLTNTEERWWCTDPQNANSDGDARGYSDGEEVTALLDFTQPRSVRWGYGPPFGPPNPWPDFNGADGDASTPACNDGDFDTIPDFAEAFFVGSRTPEESTDRDKFDDGQELFGITYCPGAPNNCGYGVYPANEYWNFIKASIPNWVLPPGDNLFVAAFPVPEVYVQPGSWNVERVTTVTTSEGEMTRTTNSYETAVTRGQSSGIENTVTWNEWEEVSEAVETPLDVRSPSQVTGWKEWGKIVGGTTLATIGTVGGAALLAGGVGACFASIVCGVGVVAATAAAGIGGGVLWDGVKEEFSPDNHQEAEDINTYSTESSSVDVRSEASASASVTVANNIEMQGVVESLDGVQYAFNKQGELLSRGLQDISYQISRPRFTETRTSGKSWGGAQTTTHEEYEEHTIAEGQAFASGQTWETAWAVDSSHAADLSFVYTVQNNGTEYAREVTSLIFNIYLGDDKEPLISYPAWQQFADGKLENLFPVGPNTPPGVGSSRIFASSKIPLSLEEMKRIDLGERITIKVENFNYGADELFYTDAVTGGLTAYIEDGVEDGDESVDMYVLPTWGDESVQDVLTRYFPSAYDEDGLLNALWTPEFAGAGDPVWNEHFLSDIAWWNVYLTQADAGNTSLRDLRAQAGSGILFRFNRDSDRDGYNDRAEYRYFCGLPSANPDAVHCEDGHLKPEVHPRPEILAGYVVREEGDRRIVTLALENTGTFDAYGIDAVIFSPDDSTTIDNNTVGGNGRVRPGQHVAVGSLIKAPDLTDWNNSTSRPYAGGNYGGNTDRTYTFSTLTAGNVGSGPTQVRWENGEGISGTLKLGAVYNAPLPIDIEDGLEVGFNSGSIEAGESFTVDALTPRDTFSYTVDSANPTPPVIVVSYSDPQGSHRFVTAVELSDIQDSLTPFAGQMKQDLRLQIVTNSELDSAGANTTSLILNNPHDIEIQDGHLYLNFVSDGTLVLEKPYTLDFPAGPTTFDAGWNVSEFSGDYNPDGDNILIAFWTDSENNIIDSAARPLPTFADDPRPEAALVQNQIWDFGSAQQGTLMEHQFALGSVGYAGLLTYLGNDTGLSVDGPASTVVSPGDVALYTVRLNTEELPVGPYQVTIPIRTSDPQNPAADLTIRGSITPMPADAPGGAVLRPLDIDAVIPGDHSAGEWVEFSHGLGPDGQSLHPVKVFSEDYGTLHGVGAEATDFNAGTASYDMFGDGRDGDLTLANGEVAYLDNTRASIVAHSDPTDPIVVDSINGFTVGDLVFLHQTRGTNPGRYEFNIVESIDTDNSALILQDAHKTYYAGGEENAQIIKVNQYQSVTVEAGGILTAHGWDGGTGGIAILMASGSVQIDGSLSVNGKNGVATNKDHTLDPLDAYDDFAVGGGFRGGWNTTDDSHASAGEGNLAQNWPNETVSRQGIGGGGAGGYAYGHNGGAGGGHGTPGGNGSAGSVQGGATWGDVQLSNMTFGGGGGGGRHWNYAGSGGNGGGIVALLARDLTISGTVHVNGGVGGNGTDEGDGGGGAGGAILARVSTANLGSGNITAVGGAGTATAGNGGVGRIRVEFCNPPSGTTNPTASTQQLDCYITEQVDAAPYDRARLNLPESFTGGRTYKVQYGRLLNFATPGEQTTTIRLPRQLYSDASLDALVNNTGTGAAPFALSIDFGDDGSLDWTHSTTTTFPATLNVTGTVDALNAYLVDQDGVAWGADVDVPVRVVSDRAADLLLTNLVLSLQVNQPSMRAGEVEIAADRPLDWPVHVVGTHTQGDAYDFTHSLGPDAASLHPCLVYDQAGKVLKGAGFRCNKFNLGAVSAETFGSGQDGDITIDNDRVFNAPRSSLSSVAAAGASIINLSNGSGFDLGNEILIYQVQGTGAGNYEFVRISNRNSNQISLQSPLRNTYSYGGTSKAQAIVVPNYRNVTVSASGRWRAPAWNGNDGGLLVIRASGVVNIESGGLIDLAGKGYHGGAPNCSNCRHGRQGEGHLGPGSPSGSNNGNGGGGGGSDPGEFGSSGSPSGGGGGGHATSGGGGGSATNSNPGLGGANVGSVDLSSIYFGGGGGAGGSGDGQEANVGGEGGAGGGAFMLLGRDIYISGSILSDGNEAPFATQMGGGGGGAGGSIKIVGRNINASGGQIRAQGGAGRSTNYGGGGGGSSGRIHVGYCTTFIGSTSPTAAAQQINCYALEQLDPTTTRLYLPDDVNGSYSYLIQYGRLISFTAPANEISSLRLNRRVYGGASLDLLLSNTSAASGPIALCLDIGNNNTCDYAHDAQTDFPATLEATGLAEAFNDYLLTRDDVPWGDPVDVPIRLNLDRQVDVMLTNLALTPLGAKTRFVRTRAQSYNEADITLEFRQPGTPSGPLAFTVDVGADGTVDWSYADTPGFPATLTSPNLADAFNTYLTGRSGDVDVPIRIVPSPFLDLSLVDFDATPANLPDLAPQPPTVSNVARGGLTPVEGDVVTLSSFIQNGGSAESGPLAVTFFADVEGRPFYIGSAFVPNVPLGGTNASIPWDTLGFSGDVEVSIAVDPFNRTAEADETNNGADAIIPILTRPDLSITRIELSDPEPMAGETISVTLTLSNAGQTATGAQLTTLSDGDPDAGGNPIGSETVADLPPLSTSTISFQWTPTAPGPYTLFSAGDMDNTVSEFDESNNRTRKEVYVGHHSPILLDSGPGEPAYNFAVGFGVVDEGQADVFTTCDDGVLPEETMRLDFDGRLVYRFDHLLPGHFYHLDVTLYECTGASRQESIYVDGNLVDGPINLGDGNVHHRSILLDPALYADHKIEVSIEVPGVNGAIVSAVDLHDVDYRYSDAGGVNDPQYTPELGYGWLRGNTSSAWGTLPYQSVRVDAQENRVDYRYDNLDGSRKYDIHVGLYQKDSNNRVQVIEIDGETVGPEITLAGEDRQSVSVTVPPEYYTDDGSIVVSLVRLDAASGAIINEIALEAETVGAGRCSVAFTPYWTTVSGEVLIAGQPAPVGSTITAENPDGEVVGCSLITQPGQLEPMNIYGADSSSSPPIPGMKEGEQILFRVDGVIAAAEPILEWSDDKDRHNLTLAVEGTVNQSIRLNPGWNLISVRVRPPVTAILSVLHSIEGRYCMILGQLGTYSCNGGSTLTNLLGASAYFVRLDGGASATLLIKGTPIPGDTLLALEGGWNWVPYLLESEMEVEQALAGIAPQLVRVADGRGRIYEPALADRSTLLRMEPNLGYLIFVSEATGLTYPLATTRSEPLPAQRSTECPYVAATPYFTWIYGSLTINGRPAPVGSRVEAWTPREELAGCFRIDEAGEYGFLTLFGADGGDPPIPGFKAGEAVALRVNGAPVILDDPLLWQGDQNTRRLDLSLDSEESLFLPFVEQPLSGPLGRDESSFSDLLNFYLPLIDR